MTSKKKKGSSSRQADYTDFGSLQTTFSWTPSQPTRDTFSANFVGALCLTELSALKSLKKVQFREATQFASKVKISDFENYF